MASLSELEARLIVVENTLSNAIVIPSYAIDVDSPDVKVGDVVIGKKAGINGGFMFFGKANTAPPTTNAHIDDMVSF